MCRVGGCTPQKGLEKCSATVSGRSVIHVRPEFSASVYLCAVNFTHTSSRSVFEWREMARGERSCALAFTQVDEPLMNRSGPGFVRSLSAEGSTP